MPPIISVASHTIGCTSVRSRSSYAAVSPAGPAPAMTAIFPIFLYQLMKNIRLPHPEIPDQHDPHDDNPREEVVQAPEIDEEVQEELGPEEPADRDQENQRVFLQPVVPVFEHPENAQGVVPDEPRHVREECGGQIVDTEKLREDAVRDEIDDG